MRPDAGKTRLALAEDAELAAGADENLFDAADVIHCADAGREAAQVEDGVADELSGAVVRDITASVGFEDFNAA